MYAVEFEAKIDNGIIKIPSQYDELRNVNDVRLVIMYNKTDDLKYAKSKSDSLKFDKFLSISKQVDSIKTYTRDELHER